MSKEFSSDYKMRMEEDPLPKGKENRAVQIAEIKRRVGTYFSEHPDYVWKWGLTIAGGILATYLLSDYFKSRKQTEETKTQLSDTNSSR